MPVVVLLLQVWPHVFYHPTKPQNFPQLRTISPPTNLENLPQPRIVLPTKSASSSTSTTSISLSPSILTLSYYTSTLSAFSRPSHTIKMFAHQANQPANAGGNTTRSLWPTLEQFDSIRAAALDPITQLQRTPLYFSEETRAETLRTYGIKEEFHGTFIQTQVFIIATETETGKTTQVPTWA